MKRKNLLSRLLVSCVTTTVFIAPQIMLGQTNVYDNVIATSANHTTLKAALDQEGLDAVLQDANATYTVFAPTNAAFDSLASRLNTNLAGLLALNNLSDILTYHVLGTTVASGAISNGDTVSPLFNANSVKMTVTSNSEVFANHAEVTTPDLTADNGVVHSVNEVLLFDETVVDVALDNGFSTLTTALVQEELVPTLVNPFAEYTVFAPTNDAFDDAVAALGIDIPALLALNNLTDILTYHVLGSEVDAASITNGTVANPLSATNSLKLTKTDADEVFINQAQVTTADVAADNGLVHIVDAVLLPNETVVDAALDGGYSTLVTAVQQAELVPTLSDPFGTFTVFAPTNEAFNNLATALNTDLAGILALDNLADILTYHVLGEEVLAAGVTHGGIVQPISQTNTLKTSVHANGDVFINQAQVTATDITVDNGIVHELNAAVLPSETVVDVALDNGFSSLATAVITAELLATLSDPFAEYTVFAPTNDAFDNIATDLGTDLNGVLALENLSDILLYHVVSGTTLSTELMDGEITALNMENLTVDLSDGVKINRATVVTADVAADNGVVHAIDRVMLVEPLAVSELTTGELKFFPNPTVDLIQVSGLNNADFQIFALDGSLVKAGNVQGSAINVTDLPSGTYMINVTDETSLLQSKMVKM